MTFLRADRYEEDGVSRLFISFQIVRTDHLVAFPARFKVFFWESIKTFLETDIALS